MSIGKLSRILKRKHGLCNSQLEERIVAYQSTEGVDTIIFCPKCGIEVDEDQETRNERRDKKPKVDRSIRRRRSYDEWD